MKNAKSLPNKIKFTQGYDFKAVEMDAVLGREVTTRSLSVDEMREVASRYNEHAALVVVSDKSDTLTGRLAAFLAGDCTKEDLLAAQAEHSTSLANLAAVRK